MDEVRSNVAGELRAARVRAELSLAAMAKRMGVSRAAVARCESGTPMSERTIYRYARALGLDVEIRLVPRTTDEASDG